MRVSTPAALCRGGHALKGGTPEGIGGTGLPADSNNWRLGARALCHRIGGKGFEGDLLEVE